MPPNLQIDAATGVITAQGGALTATPGTYQITITATDNAGKAVSETFTWVVLPANIMASTTQDITVSPTSLLNGYTGLSITGILVNGSPQSNLTFTDAKGGIFTLHADGSYSFDPGSGYDYLFVDDSTTSSIGYVVTNQDGNTATTTLTVTIHGIDDAPTAPNPITISQVSHDGDTVSLSIGKIFHDVDEGDTLTYRADNLPPGLSIDSVTGIISGQVSSTASLHSPYTVTITATDSPNLVDSAVADQSVSSTFTWIIKDPEAVNDKQTGTVLIPLAELFPEDVGIPGLKFTIDAQPTFGHVHYSRRLQAFVYRQQGSKVPSNVPRIPTDPSVVVDDTFPDSFTVTVTDPNGIADTTTVGVTVTDVPPTGSFSVTTVGGTVSADPLAKTAVTVTVPEASPVTLQLAGVTDPSLADRTAGFAYAFEVDGTWQGAPTSTPAFNHTFTDGFANPADSTHTIVERVFDELGGFTDYTATVIVTNVAPTADIKVEVHSDGTADLSILGNDVSPDDSQRGLHYFIDFGDVTKYDIGTSATYDGAKPISSMTSVAGVVDVPSTLLARNFDLLVSVVVVDKDGGTTTYFVTVPHDISQGSGGGGNPDANTQVFAQATHQSDAATDKAFAQGHLVLTAEGILVRIEHTLGVTSDESVDSKSFYQSGNQIRQLQVTRVVTPTGLMIDLQLNRTNVALEIGLGNISSLQAGDDSVYLFTEILGSLDPAPPPIRLASIEDDHATTAEASHHHHAVAPAPTAAAPANDAGGDMAPHTHWVAALIVAIVLFFGGVAYVFVLRRPIEVMIQVWRTGRPSKHGSAIGNGSTKGAAPPGSSATVQGGDNGQTIDQPPTGTVPDSST